MNIADIQPFITPLGVIAAAGIAVFGYGRQKKLELEKALIETRRETYRRYLSALVNVFVQPGKESNDQHHLLCVDLSLVASDESLKKIGDLAKCIRGDGLGNKINAPAALKLIPAAVLAMRNDCFAKSNLNADDINTLLPFSATDNVTK